MPKSTLSVKEIAEAIEQINAQNAASKWPVTPGLSPEQCFNYAEQEYKQIQRILKDTTVAIRMVMTHQNGLANFETYNAQGEVINTLTYPQNLEELPGYEGIPIDKSSAIPYSKTITVKEAAEMLGCSVKNVYYFIKMGRIERGGNGVIKSSVELYNVTRKRGRPTGSFKETK
jgi:hypothetical protein